MTDNGNILSFGLIDDGKILIPRQPVHHFDEIGPSSLLSLNNVAGFLGVLHDDLVWVSRRGAVNDRTRQKEVRSIAFFGCQLRPELAGIKRTRHLANPGYSVYEIHGVGGFKFSPVHVHIPQARN